MAVVERPIDFVFLADSSAIQGLFCSMIASTKPPSAAAWRISARSLVVGREPHEPRLARLANRLGGFLELLALGPFHFGREVVVPHGVNEDQIDVVGLERVEPFVQLRLIISLGASGDGPW